LGRHSKRVQNMPVICGGIPVIIGAMPFWNCGGA
jgi:hypothetical protein